MFGNMNWKIQHFHLLYDFEVVGCRESKFANVRGANLIGDFLIHTIRRQRLTKLSLMTFLSTTFALLAAIGLLLGWLDDITRC